MSCKYKIGNIEFNSKEEVKEFLTKRENISFNIRKEIVPSTVPDFTAHKQTDRWLGVAFRRILKLAVDEGYSGVAIATGQQSADMYSLAKSVEKVNWENQYSTGDALVSITLKGNTSVDNKFLVNRETGIISNTLIGSNYDGKKFDDLVGKDLANKVASEKFGVLEGEGLEFGGEGMKTFYDKIVPKVVQKEAQRFDKNAKLETVDFGAKNERVRIAELNSEIKTNEDISNKIGNSYKKNSIISNIITRRGLYSLLLDGEFFNKTAKEEVENRIFQAREKLIKTNELLKNEPNNERFKERLDDITEDLKDFTDLLNEINKEDFNSFKTAIENIENAKKELKTLNTDKLSLGVQPYLPLTQPIKDSVSVGVPLFSLNQQQPKLKYQNQKGEFFDSYSEALKNSNEQDIEAGVNTTTGFKTLFTINPNTNIDTEQGVINNLIKIGAFSGVSYKEGGNTHYKAEGQTYVKQRANAEMAREVIQKQLGVKTARINADNTVTIISNNNRNIVKIVNEQGEEMNITREDLKKPFAELKKMFDQITTANILAGQEFLNATNKVKSEQTEEFVPENELQQKIINLLKKFGIKTLSFEQYLEGYGKRNNMPINAKALADLANKVIAFKDGIIEEDELLEEVAHLIEASIPMEQKENILRNIHKTQEWMQYAEEYKAIYATEEEVRREILGKVIANSLKEQFQARNSNQTENSIIAKIKQFFEEFLARIQSFFQESYRGELENLQKQIYRNIMNETLDLNINSKGVFYSTGNASTKSQRIFDTSSKVLERLQDQERTLSKRYKNPADRALVGRAKELLDEIDEAEKMKGVATLVRLTSSQVETLLKSAESKPDGQYPLSSEENVVYQNIIKRIRPSLAEIEHLLDKNDKLQLDMLSELSKIQEKVKNLEGIVGNSRDLAIKQMVDNLIRRADMTDKEAEEYRSIVEAALHGKQKDTDFLHAHLGSLLMARNPVLNMAGNIIERMNLQSIENFQRPFKKLTNFLNSVNFSQKDWEQLVTDNFEILNEIDSGLVEKNNKETRKQILENSISTLSPYDYSFINVEQDVNFKDLLENNPTKKEEIQLLEKVFQNSWKKELKSRRESYFEKAYIDRMNSHSIEINGEKVTLEDISANALSIDAQYRAESTQIKINSGDNLTKADQAQLKEISKRRQEDTNPRTASGEFIQGITEVFDQNSGRYFIIEDTAETSKMELKDVESVRTIVGLNHISYVKQDFFSKENPSTGELPQTFLNALEGLTEQEKMEFIENNSYISFPDSFYEQFKENPGLTSRLRDLGTEEAQDKIDEIRVQQAIINRVLKANSVYNKPSETNYIEMTDVQVSEVKLAQTELERLYSEAKLLLGNEVVESELEMNTIPNEAYFNYLQDTGEDELEFIFKNVTPSGRSAIEAAKRIANGGRISKSFEKWFNSGMTQAEKQEALINYARTKLLPYLKRTEPKGYSEALEEIKKGTLTVEEFISNKDLIKISPSFSFYEATNKNINKKWVANNKAKKEQWTEEYMKKVRNQNYFDMFAFDGEGNPTKNKNLWEAREKILEYSDEMIEYNNLTGTQSRYMIPGVRRTKTQRFTDTSIKGVKETLMDSLQFRPEEQEKGGMLTDSLYTIPTYYNTPLQDKDEQTKDYLYAYAMYGQAAALHKARRENISDMFVLEDALSFNNSQATNTMKMFKNFMEFNFYGKKENFSLELNAFGRTIDVGKILKTLNNFAKMGNLAGITVPITSALQSSTQKVMERIIGETIDPQSANEGDKLFCKYAPAAAKEIMSFESKSVLNVIGEGLGVYSVVHRFENSQLGKGGRALINANSKMHELGNFPVIPRAFLGIISSYRYVDGKILSYNKFKQKMEVQGFKGNIKAEWAKHEKFSEDFISAVKDGVLDFKNEDFLARVGAKLNIPSEEVEQYLQDKKEDISKRTLAFIQRIDSQIPQHQRSVWSRDSRANFFLSHLNWLLAAIPRKLKNRHYDFSEETFQEGSWRTAVNFIQKIAFKPKDFKKVYAELDENQRKNLKRTVIELGFANALGLMAMVLSNYVDDDDDPAYAVAVADMFMSRLAVEQISSTVGLPTAVWKITENPIMLQRKITDWAQVNNLVSGDEKKRNKYLKGLVPFYKEIDRFNDPTRTRQTYMYFSEEKTALFDSYAWLTNLYDDE